jgi:hypothetical protein
LWWSFQLLYQGLHEYTAILRLDWFQLYSKQCIGRLDLCRINCVCLSYHIGRFSQVGCFCWYMLHYQFVQDLVSTDFLLNLANVSATCRNDLSESLPSSSMVVPSSSDSCDSLLLLMLCLWVLFECPSDLVLVLFLLNLLLLLLLLFDLFAPNARLL